MSHDLPEVALPVPDEHVSVVREQLRDAYLTIQLMLSELGGEFRVSDKTLREWDYDGHAIHLERQPDFTRVLRLRPADV